MNLTQPLERPEHSEQDDNNNLHVNEKWFFHDYKSPVLNCNATASRGIS